MSDSENLDVRQLVPMQRHSTIFSTWQNLTPGTSFVLINDHDPKPLRYQSEALWPGRFDRGGLSNYQGSPSGPRSGYHGVAASPREHHPRQNQRYKRPFGGARGL